MLHITSLDDGLDIFKALGSDVRIEIIKLLIENKEMNMNELAAKLNILRFFRCVQINEDFIQMQSTDFLVSVPAGIIGGIDNSACLQFFYMSRQSTVRNVQFCCQFVHVHFFVFNQQFYNFNPNIGA